MPASLCPQSMLVRRTLNKLDHGTEKLENYSLPIELRFDNSKGFYMVLTRKAIPDKTLPSIFIGVSTKKHIVRFTSLQLDKLNRRMNEALNEVLLMSEMIVEDLILKIQERAGSIYKASEATAMLDMVCCRSRHVQLLRRARSRHSRPLARRVIMSDPISAIPSPSVADVIPFETWWPMKYLYRTIHLFRISLGFNWSQVRVNRSFVLELIARL